MPHAELAADPPRITLKTQFNEKELVKQIPGSAWDPYNKEWTLPLSWAACLQLRGTFSNELTVGPELTQWSHAEFAQRVAPAREIREQLTRVSGYPEQMYDYQTAGAEFLRLSDGALLGDDLGLGKTAQALAALDRVSASDPNGALPALVICPNSVKAGWARQVDFWGTNVNPYVVEGGATQRRKILEKASHDPRALVIINIEAVRLFSRLAPFGSIRLARCRECSRHGEERITPAKCDVHAKPLNTLGFRTVIIDECHRIKDPNSKQTRACWAVAHGHTVKRRWGLTGTPVVNHVGDFWSIAHMLAPHEFPTKSKFVDTYALQAWGAFGGLEIVGINPLKRDEFNAIIDSRFRRTPKELVLTNLPPVIRPTRWVDMAPKQRTAYRDIAARLVTELSDGSVLVAPNSLTKATRLLQLSSSYAEVEWLTDPSAEGTEDASDFKVRLTEPSPKLDAVMEDIEALANRRVVVAAESRQLIELLAKRLTKAKISYGMITGAVPDYDRQVNIRRFVSGETRVMLLTIKAGGTGVDGLQVADTLLCLQRSWSMVDNVQLDGRVVRIGSEVHRSIAIVDYVTRDTIEELVQYPRLREKLNRLDEINQDRARLIRNGVQPTELYTLDLEIQSISDSVLNR